MANICPISPPIKDEISQNFNTTPFSSNKETFDPGDFSKPWKNKARRKFVSSVLAQRLRNYELTLPKSERGSWNTRTAYEYVPRLKTKPLPWEDDIIGEYERNKYGEILYEPTDIERKNDSFYNLSENTGNQLRWKRIENCLSEISEAVDQTSGLVIYKATYKCNDKLCGNCSQMRSLVAVTKYKSKVQAMKNPVMVVLHQKNPEMGKLKETINAMYSDWREILRLQAKSKRENYNGICALEVTTNEKEKTFHPHYHIIIEKHQANELVNKWVSSDPINRTLFAHTNKQTRQLYSELPKDEKGDFTIKELFKYAMKLSVTNQDKPGSKTKTMGSTEMIYEIAKALKGVQQWRPFGNFRETPNTKEISQVIQDEMTVTPGEWPHIKLSKRWIYQKYDWVAHDIPGMNLTDYKPQERDIAFLRLTEFELFTFTDENENRKNKPEQFPACKNTLSPGVNETIQAIFTSETNKRSIHHYKQPEQ